MNLVTLLVITAALVLLYSAVKGENPKDLIAKAFGDKK